MPLRAAGRSIRLGQLGHRVRHSKRSAIVSIGAIVSVGAIVSISAIVSVGAAAGRVRPCP
eukprot:scaffold109227_cov69-Phaeocystis_antarctica.AAC.1